MDGWVDGLIPCFFKRPGYYVPRTKGTPPKNKDAPRNGRSFYRGLFLLKWYV